ncbi:MAG TPA: holo-ACP synthase [Steroidobacteraceae bacterium]|nr:holo-ACP synthase [Steroidobacteraceae bacterium]
MIFGIGTDLVQVERIEATYRRFGRHFVDRLLMPEEHALFDPERRAVRFLAMRFAAKEAISKALGTGFRHGVWIRDLGFRPNPWGKPEVIFSPRGRAVADRLGAGEGHVSLTDEAGLVVAFAVLMRKGA